MTDDADADKFREYMQRATRHLGPAPQIPPSVGSLTRGELRIRGSMGGPTSPHYQRIPWMDVAGPEHDKNSDNPSVVLDAIEPFARRRR